MQGLSAFDALVEAVSSTALSEEDQQSMEELRQYLGGEGSWVLGDEFLAFVGRVLGGEVGEGGGARGALLACLAACALREDVSLLLHQDRREHALLGHAADIDRLARDDQLHLATLMCNLFASVSASEWLLYISEWEVRGRTYSNIRVTTKVCPTQRCTQHYVSYMYSTVHVVSCRVRRRACTACWPRTRSCGTAARRCCTTSPPRR